MVGISSGADAPGGVTVTRPSCTSRASRGEFQVRIVNGVERFVFLTVMRRVGTGAGLSWEMERRRSLREGDDWDIVVSV